MVSTKPHESPFCLLIQAMQTLARCSSLSFLTLSLDGFSDVNDGAEQDGDLWAGLERLTAVLSCVVCLDVSECRMKDQNLNVSIVSIIEAPKMR